MNPNLNKRIGVLGAGGMLGHVVARRLRQKGWEVVEVSDRWTPDRFDQCMGNLKDLGLYGVVNAIGVHLSEAEATPRNRLKTMQWINGLFPQWLAKGLDPDVRVIHASSDAVFGASECGCLWDQPHSADTAYGASKIQGETGMRGENRWVIRCSLLGPDRESCETTHLLSWVLGQQRAAWGYTNHMWNGITTLAWADLAHVLLSEEQAVSGGLVQPGFLPPITKYTLLKTIDRVYGLGLQVRPTRAASAVNRSLIPTQFCDPIEEQLQRLKTWYEPS